MRMKKIAALVAVLGIAVSAHALTLDGLVSDLGPAVASDPVIPAAGEGGAGPNAPMDLADLYVTEDGAGNIHIGLTIATDIGASNWGKYKVFIQTDNGGAGSTTDPWGRAINCGGTFSPQYNLSCWVDGTMGSELYKWNGASWTLLDNDGTVNDLDNGHAMAVSANGNGGRGGVEWWLTRAALGNCTTVQVEATCTGGGGGDNGQDTVPSDVNATDWGTVTVLDSPTAPPITVPVTMSGFVVE